MAGGKVKKGFTTYLVILLLLIVTAFLITVCVMFFSPFKNVLGFKYFSYRTEKYYYNETTNLDSEGKIDFTQLNEINIDCNYANVEVIRYVKLDFPAIKITNKAVGFAKSSQDTDFNFSILYDEDKSNTINVTIDEPEGFLYFSKDVKVSLLIPSSYDHSFENVKINVINTSGKVFIGNNGEVSKGETNIDIESINIKTNKGKTIVSNYVNTTFDEFFFKSESGSLVVKSQIEVDNLSIYSKSGSIDFNKINYIGSDKVKFDLHNSKLEANEINGNINLSIKCGYLDIKKLNGSLIANDSINQMSAATITIEEMTGNVSLPYANKSKIDLGKLNESSQVYINATSGNITIEELHGESWIETTSGDVSIHTYADDISVKTKSGKINVIYDNSNIYNQLDFSSEKGNIDIKIKGDLKFILEIYDLEGKLRKDSKISLDFYDDFKNPLIVNNGTNKMIVTTKAKVNISLIG